MDFLLELSKARLLTQTQRRPNRVIFSEGPRRPRPHLLRVRRHLQAAARPLPAQGLEAPEPPLQLRLLPEAVRSEAEPGNTPEDPHRGYSVRYDLNAA